MGLFVMLLLGTKYLFMYSSNECDIVQVGIVIIVIKTICQKK